MAITNYNTVTERNRGSFAYDKAIRIARRIDTQAINGHSNGARHAVNTRNSESLINMRITDFCWLILINCLIGESILQSIFPPFGYLDEFMALLLLVLSFFKASRTSVSIGFKVWPTVLCFAIFIAIGFVGNIFTPYQKDIVPIFIDLFACIKFAIAILSGIIVLDDVDTVFRVLRAEGKLLVCIMLPFALANLFIDVGMSFDARRGLRSFAFIFGHPFSMNIVLVCCLMLFNARQDCHFIWSLLACILMILSLRSVAIGYAVLSMLYIAMIKGGRRVTAFHAVFGIIILLYLGFDQIGYYYQTAGTARSELSRAAFNIATSNFPFGTGFATFGSNITASLQYYSSLYYQYGLANIIGLQYGSASFLSDAFHPILIAQFGLLGTVAYIAGILSLSLSRQASKMDRWFKCSSARDWVSTHECAFIKLVLSSIFGSDRDNDLYLYESKKCGQISKQEIDYASDIDKISNDNLSAWRKLQYLCLACKQWLTPSDDYYCHAKLPLNVCAEGC